jgi:5'(3')-deoxyribonucleotidase
MPQIFIDMDGVVADFDQGVAQALNISSQELAQVKSSGRWGKTHWDRLVAEYPRIYRILPKMAKADKMIELAVKFRDDLNWELRMLTAVPKDNDVPDAFRDKINWMSEQYPGIPVWFGPYSRDKSHHCRSGDILVDDRKDNCENWRAAGGLAIRVTDDYDLALEQLNTVYLNLKSK